MSLTPLYRKIAEDIHHRIRTGQYPPGAKIPSYRELAKLWDASISTVQRGLALLHDRQVVTGHQGRGVYVTPTRP